MEIYFVCFIPDIFNTDLDLKNSDDFLQHKEIAITYIQIFTSCLIKNTIPKHPTYHIQWHSVDTTSLWKKSIKFGPIDWYMWLYLSGFNYPLQQAGSYNMWITPIIISEMLLIMKTFRWGRKNQVPMMKVLLTRKESTSRFYTGDSKSWVLYF